MPGAWLCDGASAGSLACEGRHPKSSATQAHLRRRENTWLMDCHPPFSVESCEESNPTGCAAFTEGQRRARSSTAGGQKYYACWRRIFLNNEARIGEIT